jgi:pyruvate,orthophosphate dikinase
MTALRRAVLLPQEGAEATMSSQVRGGKGAKLAEMAALELPVPPFFTIPTGICRAYMEYGRFPRRFWWHLQRGIAALEKATGREFGSVDNPLLVSVRSGAPDSMPGMMDTVLNVGMTLDARPALASLGGKRFARDVHSRLREQLSQFEPDYYRPYGMPDDLGYSEEPIRQLVNAITAVMESWNSERARAYRQANGIPGWTGTAVNIQSMVFGNLDDNSGTGVVFSANPATGEDGMHGEWLKCAQGEDIVSGTRTPESIASLAVQMPAVYAELEGYVQMLSSHLGEVADVEFTVEAGKLYVLQFRKAKLPAVAAATRAVRQVWSKAITKEQAVSSLTEVQIRQLRTSSFSSVELEQAMATSTVASGLAASPGAAVGYVAHTSEEALEMVARGMDVVLVRPDTSPDDLPGMLVSKAIVTGNGGTTCHAAVVARAHGIPAVVGVGENQVRVLSQACDYVSVEGTKGVVLYGALELNGNERTKEVNLFLKWASKARFTPRLDFSLMDQQFCVNRVINNFYLSDAMAAASVGSVLENEAASLRWQVHTEAAVLMGTYLALAAGREIRHGHCRDLSYVQWEDAAADQLVKRLVHVGWDEEEAMEETARSLPLMELEDQIRFADLAMRVFDLPIWGYSPGVGGPRWADIARALLGYLDGSMQVTKFVDHAFDLRHNAGVLFNKHDMVRAQTDEGGVLRQLDIKKRVSGPSSLYNELGMLLYRVDWRDPPNRLSEPFSKEVMGVYRKGEQLGLW